MRTKKPRTVVIKDRLAEVMTEQNITPKQLAEIVGVSHSTVYNWLSGRTRPKLNELIKLCDVLNVKVHYMFTGEGERRTSN